MTSHIVTIISMTFTYKTIQTHNSNSLKLIIQQFVIVFIISCFIRAITETKNLKVKLIEIKKSPYVKLKGMQIKLHHEIVSNLKSSGGKLNADSGFRLQTELVSREPG